MYRIMRMRVLAGQPFYLKGSKSRVRREFSYRVSSKSESPLPGSTLKSTNRNNIKDGMKKR